MVILMVMVLFMVMVILMVMVITLIIITGAETFITHIILMVIMVMDTGILKATNTGLTLID